MDKRFWAVIALTLVLAGTTAWMNRFEYTPVGEHTAIEYDRWAGKVYGMQCYKGECNRWSDLRP